MRKLLSLLCMVCLTGTAIQAQTPASAKNPNPAASKFIRCGTMEYEAQLRASDPLFDQHVREQADAKLRNRAHQRPTNNEDVVVIPIVFHVVGTAAHQAYASERAIQRQVDVLNMRFGGLNADSADIPDHFKNLFGHSHIRFALARRTPTGAATNGIERRVSTASFTSGTVNNLKRTASGGLDQWNGDNYFNVWIANFTDGLLGIATFPNMGDPTLQGVCIGISTLDEVCNNPDPTITGVFDKGITLVHEAGHYFYLYHIWGDDSGACSGDDFRLGYGNLPGACTDDTPNQAGATSGCFSGVATDACSASAPGFMYQNYMDYSNDGCLYMFTPHQMCRMEAALDLYRASLKTSNGCTPVTPNNNNARVSEIVYPSSRGFACGTTALTCDNVIAPKVMLVNDGDAPLTSVTFQIKIDNAIVATQNWSGSLGTSDFEYVTLNGVTSPTGTHVLTVKTVNPNGQPDGTPANDSMRATYRIIPIINLPQPLEGFQTATFPPLNWRVINPDADITWARSTAAGSAGTTASTRIDCYNYPSAGEQDILVSPNFSTAGVDSLEVKFNVAYAKYSDNPAEWETLEVLYSEDCGGTWKRTSYSKTGNDLITNGGALVTAATFVPTAAQWRSETVKLGLCGVGSTILIGFRVTNNYGQAVYLDNIQYNKIVKPDPNIAVSRITSPNGLYCNGSFTPKVEVANNGSSTVTSFTLTYKIDGGTPATYNWTGSLAKCTDPIVVTLPAQNLGTGSHTFEATVSQPNGVADVFAGDDSKIANFTILTTVQAPVTESFEGTSFPPANWAIQNSDGGLTWESTNRSASLGGKSMVIKNFDNPLSSSVDSFVSPRIVIPAASDSAFVSFDYAYAPGVQYPGSTVFALDTLELKVTTDCGATSTTIWKKYGYQLQTVFEPNFTFTNGYVPRINKEWRSEKINILPYVQNAADFQVYFVSSSNQQNNLYVDNINIYSQKLPERLKQQGYLIYPNPFNSSFRIHHSAVEPPVDLQAVMVYNTAGQLVWSKQYNGNADRVITVNTESLARGVYVLKMMYTNKTVVERIVKN